MTYSYTIYIWTNVIFHSWASLLEGHIHILCSSGDEDAFPAQSSRNKPLNSIVTPKNATSWQCVWKGTFYLNQNLRQHTCTIYYLVLYTFLYIFCGDKNTMAPFRYPPGGRRRSVVPPRKCHPPSAWEDPVPAVVGPRWLILSGLKRAFLYRLTL